ncbi:hypothetical protein [Bacteriovorax sp. Seq25_V]|uniref:hypothetical protein n=1 Tax=Bacteriovorax sp. Seq25_V TaxID=1201288 RepID=UPI00038A233C|nr:hypothetical protein [Bacteriovorax sp. Seq25_V]EQC46670.1 hypothetical protein M900_2404 [Bacteriovorax sp. Seq25_V]
MKFVFKSLLFSTLLSTQVLAREIIVISYVSKSQSVEFFLSQMKEEVTAKLVTAVQSDKPCEDIYKEVVLHICFDQDDNLNLVRQNTDILQKTISKL